MLPAFRPLAMTVLHMLVKAILCVAWYAPTNWETILIGIELFVAGMMTGTIAP